MSAPIPNSKETKISRPKFEIADILRLYLSDFLKRHKLSAWQYSVVKAILSCRTFILGGHRRRCTDGDCDHEDQSYNSCGNRHCPKCQGKAKLIWLKKRSEELLPIPYYHVVFTIPHLFNDLILYNKKTCYDLLFKASSLTLQKFSKDPKYLGAQMGFFGILHTWGQDTSFHPHIHFMVSGGGLGFDKDGNECWIPAPKNAKFLFPVKAMSKVFRGIFVSSLKKAYYADKLVIPSSRKELSDPMFFESLLDQAASRKWNVFAKKPFAGPEQVLLYIGRYTHRIAISNHRIQSIENGLISFEYIDYKDKINPKKVMTLSADEFIRRFLCHVVPKGYHRIHMYGFLANGKRFENLLKIRALLPSEGQGTSFNEEFIEGFFNKIEKPKEDTCPVCGKGVMEGFASIEKVDIKTIHPYLFKCKPPDLRITMNEKHYYSNYSSRRQIHKVTVRSKNGVNRQISR